MADFPQYDEITYYNNEGKKKRLSWTFDEETDEFFAKRFGRGRYRVLRLGKKGSDC